VSLAALLGGGCAITQEDAFHDAGYTLASGGVLALVLLSVVLVPHPRDPRALILRTPRTSPSTSGIWAGKVGAHPPHHGFGTLGRLPHVQLNLWRVGVKDSGLSLRMPLLGPRIAVRALLTLLSL
jgi:hypothetical protein